MLKEIYKIGITQGDTNGVGWETILRTFADGRMCELCTPVIYGSTKAADFYKALLPDVEAVQFNVCSSAREARAGRVNLVQVGDAELKIEPGKSTADASKAAIEALRVAVADAKSGDIAAVVTSPFCKEGVAECGFGFTGHTEYFASEFAGDAMMMMCSEELRVGLVTIHVPLAQVSQLITKERVAASIVAMRKSLKADFGIVEPRIAVLALNPHAGDGGHIGDEERLHIKPAIEEAFSQGALVFGPFAADGFFATESYKKYDGVVAMYHDQGLIPFKSINPSGVNFTTGLRLVRTSPDHGVAYDIAGGAKADEQSLRNAIYMATDVVFRRREWAQMTRRPLPHYEIDSRGQRGEKDVKDLLPEAGGDI